MTILEKAVSKMQQLPTDQQQQVLRFIEFLSFELNDPEPTTNKPDSRRNLLKKWEGAIDDGVDDISFNKKYLEGYGQK
jgi:mRNA-degrading endonuclease RelE of RelBE toxin-antitoxin system